VTENINANIYFNQNAYSFLLKKGDDNFVFLKEQLWFYGRGVEINSLKSEAQIKHYTGMERGTYIKKYLTDIKKYHFHDTGKNSPFAKDSNIQNDVYYLYEKGDNLAAFLWNVQNNHPIVYKRILKMIQSIAPYFSDFFFHPGASQTILNEKPNRLIFF
jgi:predicted ATPase